MFLLDNYFELQHFIFNVNAHIAVSIASVILTTRARALKSLQKDFFSQLLQFAASRHNFVGVHVIVFMGPDCWQEQLEHSLQGELWSDLPQSLRPWSVLSAWRQLSC